MDQTSLSLRELVAACALLLSDETVGQSSGRISEVPSIRTVRYYATHGLIEKPIDWRGRTALYGTKHLLALLAIKRLQSEGYTLDEIQPKLAGASVEDLEKLSHRTLHSVTVFLKGDAPAPASAEPKGSARQADFWMTPPVGVEEEDASSSSTPTGGVIQGVHLDPGVMLLLEHTARPIHDSDKAAIQAAAQPLLRLLHARNLIHEAHTQGDNS